MKLTEVKNEILSDGANYSGTVYVMNEEKIPHGYGKKVYPKYYCIGKFIDGVLNGPVYMNHSHYMMTCQAQNNKGNGWGMMINGGVLQFGVYRNSELVIDLTQTISWYYDKILKQNYQGAMFHCYPKAGEIFIGIPGKINEQFSSCFMGFHFMDDGSLYLGTTNDLNKNGILLKFKNDGFIEMGEWENGKLITSLSISDVLDKYWGAAIKDPLFSELFPRNSIRNKYNNIEIKSNTNYFKD